MCNHMQKCVILIYIYPEDIDTKQTSALLIKLINNQELLSLSI